MSYKSVVKMHSQPKYTFSTQYLDMPYPFVYTMGYETSILGSQK